MENEKIIVPAETAAIDTNAEYISKKGVHDQPPIIKSVFRSIFVETPKDFFNSIKNFFQRYINLFRDGIKYLKYPSVKLEPFSHKDYKSSCQHTFEFSLIIVALLIFLIKMNWISGDANLAAVYNNDLGQAFIQFFIFLCFAISYFLLVILAVLAGRFYRLVFKIPVTRQEGDILFTYLNNTLFLVTAMVALILRCVVEKEWAITNIPFQYAVFIFFIVSFGVMIFYWCKRFVKLNNVIPSRRNAFLVVVTIATSIFLGFCGSIIAFFVIGV